MHCREYEVERRIRARTQGTSRTGLESGGNNHHTGAADLVRNPKRETFHFGNGGLRFVNLR